jgi:hypothetical protein
VSADAKAWYDESGNLWKAIHDGDCKADALPHQQPGRLTETLEAVEACMGVTLRWEFRQYPDGTIGLVGYEV